MRVGAEWIYSREGWDDLPEGVDDSGWLATGFIIADTGGLRCRLKSLRETTRYS
jgi:hypothetical protein